MTETLRSAVEARRRALAAALPPGSPPVRVVVAPYRICPIGAHVDHQGGPVLGMAIGARTYLAFAPSADSTCRLTSGDFEGAVRFDLRRPEGGGPEWGRYARAAACVLRERLPARPRGWVGRVDGALPGGGLSSSASVLLAYLQALALANDVALSVRDLVELSRRAENEFVGVKSGILDPASIAGARRGHLLAIDTRAVRWEAVPLGAAAPPVRFLVAFTGRTRNLRATDFNRRVEECREAARLVAAKAGVPEATRLGDLPGAALDAHAAALPGALRRRVRHFRSESARVRRGAELWRQGDLAGFGALMNASCRSSIESYETGSDEQIRTTAMLSGLPGVLGARFSGGGYGGCSLALVRAERAEAACEEAARRFRAELPELAERARFFLVESEDGVRVLP